MIRRKTDKKSNRSFLQYNRLLHIFTFAAKFSKMQRKAQNNLSLGVGVLDYSDMNEGGTQGSL